MYKLIAIDLDGTLLNDDKKIPKENIDAVNKYMDLGYEIVFATGRRYMAAKKFLSDFKKDILIFANNGNVIRHSKNDELKKVHYLDSSNIEEVINRGKENNLDPVLHIDRFEEDIDMIVEKSPKDMAYSGYLNGEDRYKSVGKFTKNDFNKILSIVYIGRLEKLENFKKIVDINYGGKYTTYLMTNVHLAEGILEICNPNISKWISVKTYAEEKNIPIKSIVTIGDDTNDVEMIKNAGLGIAMKNAVEEVKSYADIVTKRDNNNSGVAQILEDIL